MEQVMFPILLLMIGFISGFGLMMLINVLRETGATKRINKMMEDAKKDAADCTKDSL